MRSKILLLSPPIFDFYFTKWRSEPLGLLYIKRSLENIDGIIVDIYDARYSQKKKKTLWPPSFNYLKEYYIEDTSYFSLLSNYYRFGDSLNKIINFINVGGYHLVCISSLFSAYYPDVEELTKEIKMKTEALVAVGGWAIWSDYRNISSNGKADFYFDCDGTDSLVDLINTLNGQMGISEYFSESESKYTKFENLFFDSYPKRENKYTYKNRRIASVITSRGCCYGCKFCQVPRRSGFIFRDLKSVRREFEYLIDIGIEIINLEDDNLFFELGYAQEFFDLLTEYHRRGLRYMAANGIPALNLKPHIDKALHAGFIEFNLSLVSSNKGVLSNLSRLQNREAICEIAKKSMGAIDVIVFVIAGLPLSTPKELIDDILFLSSLPVKIGFSPLYMLPNLKLFESMILPEDRRLLRGSALYKFGQEFERTDIVSIWKFVRMINKIKEVGDKIIDDENFYFFKKSIDEKVWYARKRNGLWEQKIPFTTNLPREVTISDYKGRVKEWEFY